jgi:hypothetical protein
MTIPDHASAIDGFDKGGPTMRKLLFITIGLSMLIILNACVTVLIEAQTIEILGWPKTEAFIPGEDIELSDVRVRIGFSDGTFRTISLDQVTITGDGLYYDDELETFYLDMGEMGDYFVRIAYKDISTRITYTVGNGVDIDASAELNIIVRQVESEYYVDPYIFGDEMSGFTIAYDPMLSTFVVTGQGSSGLVDAVALADAIAETINAAMDDEVDVAYSSASTGTAKETEQSVSSGTLYIFGSTDFAGFDQNANRTFANVELEYWVLGNKAVWNVTVVYNSA